MAMTNTYKLLSLVAIVAIGATLLTSTFSTTPLTQNASQLEKTPTNNPLDGGYQYINARNEFVGKAIEQWNKAGLLSKEHQEAIEHMGGLVFRAQGVNAISEEEAMQMESEGRKVVEFNLVAQSVELPVMGSTPGSPKMYKAMTFNGQVPGPTLRVTQGDIIKMTLTVPSSEPIPHSNDMHASQISAVPNFGAVMPGESLTYYFVAEVPGVFKYHCEGVNVADMDRHSLSGMNGMTIVDPVDGYKPLIVKKTEVVNGEVRDTIKRYGADAYELQFVFNELYIDENGNYDPTRMFQDHQTQSTVNGMALGYTPNNTLDELILGDANKDILFTQPWQEYENQYKPTPIFVPVGEPVRIFIQNNGNHMVNFHIVGEIMDRVWQGNRIQAEGVQTWVIGGSVDAIVELVFDEPGVYAPVNHDYGDLFSGQAIIIVAGNFFKEQLRDDLGDAVDDINYYAEVLGQPSDAIPPPGKNTIPWPKFALHGLYTDERAAEIATIIEEEWGIPQA